MTNGKVVGPAVADWLNPRRYEQCKRMIGYLHWHGGKIYLTRAEYSDMRREAQLDRPRADQAIEDLHALGMVEMREAGESFSVVLLDTDLDGACGRNGRASAKGMEPRGNPPAAPRIVLAPARKAGRRQ